MGNHGECEASRKSDEVCDDIAEIGRSTGRDELNEFNGQSENDQSCNDDGEATPIRASKGARQAKEGECQNVPQLVAPQDLEPLRFNVKRKPNYKQDTYKKEKSRNIVPHVFPTYAFLNSRRFFLQKIHDFSSLLMDTVSRELPIHLSQSHCPCAHCPCHEPRVATPYTKDLWH